MSMAGVDKLFHYKRLEQFQRHFFRQAALVQLQFRSDHDNRTTGVVDTFTKQVLTETALFSFKHVAERFQGPVAGTCHRTSASTVIDQSVNSLLQHPFFIADDDIRRLEFQQTFQPIVAVNDSTIEIVQVRGGETSTVQLDHRSQFRRDDRNNIHDHPMRFVA